MKLAPQKVKRSPKVQKRYALWPSVKLASKQQDMMKAQPRRRHRHPCAALRTARQNIPGQSKPTRLMHTHKHKPTPAAVHPKFPLQACTFNVHPQRTNIPTWQLSPSRSWQANQMLLGYSAAPRLRYSYSGSVDPFVTKPKTDTPLPTPYVELRINPEHPDTQTRPTIHDPTGSTDNQNSRTQLSRYDQGHPRQLIPPATIC